MNFGTKYRADEIVCEILNCEQSVFVATNQLGPWLKSPDLISGAEPWFQILPTHD
jgi:hypothetical protein